MSIEQQVNCSTCPWNKLCIQPPSMTRAEIDNKVNSSLGKMNSDKEDKEGGAIGAMMTAVMLGGRDRECFACEVFVDKLRESPELSNKIKELMKSM